MTGKTHLAIGLASGVAVAQLTNVNNWLDLVFTVAISGVAALVPDIDTESSKINRFFFAKVSNSVRIFALIAIGLLLIAYQRMVPAVPLWILLIGVFLIISSLVPHRTLTHSLIACIFVAWVLELAWSQYAIAGIVGYLSHIIADMLTVSGVPFLWPWSQRFSLKQIGIEIRTGKTFDEWLGHLSYLFAICGFVYLLL
ncbi:LexA-binding, inner membrane-associated putative hydrolase [Seinonella peptonophila]|uniref:LexA-binding, inner membrane-associated putative hydrolase n=1 Tax=Seinonella peptonophila TaxID=112248 RepID=A0A1M4U7V4_9BACL|nr:metal-dependent hydrolase [Seinonella peptonophila]SHE52951.1 LexA-binding, inner membrane-associated putative hydrolase [Seinonella peptonophila]